MKNEQQQILILKIAQKFRNQKLKILEQWLKEKSYENIKMFEQWFKEKCKNILKISGQFYTGKQPTANICSKDRAKISR